MRHFNQLVLCYKSGRNLFAFWSEMLTKEQRIEVCEYLGCEFLWAKVLEKIKSA